MEMARLLGFPVAESPASEPEGRTLPFRTFGFPPECTMKQQWKLMGNSINVHVAALVAELGIRSVIRDRV